MVTIIEDVRNALGLSKDDKSFDPEIVMHVNAAVADLAQNNVVKEELVQPNDEWSKLRKVGDKSDYMFEQVKLYIFLRTKLLFDPPPPSTGQYMSARIEELLWRLRESYDYRKEESNE